MPQTQPIVSETENSPVVPKKAKGKIFFPHLDGLRFFSYAAVFLFHVWLLLFDRYRITGTTEKILKFLFQNGEVGVNFFFVLSGFLITYLLIEEKRITGKIHVTNFYMRRILRIWPLFYLMVIFGLVVYPQLKTLMGESDFKVANPWTYFVFLNNFDFLKHGAPAMISILWSVAIEEQFYLCWPLILALVPLKKQPWVFYIIIAGSLIFRSFHVHDERVLLFNTFAVIGDMAMGGLMAYLIIFHDGFKKSVEHLPKLLIALIYVLAFTLLFFRKDIFQGSFVIFERLCFAIVFGSIILEQNFSNHSFWKLGNYRRISQLGIYTYGLYCIHVSSLTFVEIALRKIGLNMANPAVLLLTGAIAFFVAIGLAWLSYHYFEKRFLKLKDKFAFIVKK